MWLAQAGINIARPIMSAEENRLVLHAEGDLSDDETLATAKYLPGRFKCSDRQFEFDVWVYHCTQGDEQSFWGAVPALYSITKAFQFAKPQTLCGGRIRKTGGGL